MNTSSIIAAALSMRAAQRLKGLAEDNKQATELAALSTRCIELEAEFDLLAADYDGETESDERMTVAAALEEFIKQLDEDERVDKVIATRSGGSWSMNDMLREIQQRTPEGVAAVLNVINLTIDQIRRGRKRL